MMSPSDIAAWWGASVATLVFAWDIYKWKSTGPRLVVRAVPNMQELDDPEEKKLVSVEVTNRGDRPTTLTHLAFYGYANWLSKTIKRRNKKVGIVYRPGGGQGLPFVLAPGERWLGLAEQKIIAEYYQDQYLYAAICHSGSSRDSLCRVQLGW